MTEATTQSALTNDAVEARADVTIGDIRVEHLRDALGIGTAAPQLSWIVETERPDWLQAGYEIEALGSDGDPRGSTGLVQSDQSVLVPWPFTPLQSRERVAVRVRVQGADGSASDWSALKTS